MAYKNMMKKGKGEAKMATLLPDQFKATHFMGGEYGNNEHYNYGIEYQNSQMAADNRKLRAYRSEDRY